MLAKRTLLALIVVGLISQSGFSAEKASNTDAKKPKAPENPEAEKKKKPVAVIMVLEGKVHRISGDRIKAEDDIQTPAVMNNAFTKEKAAATYKRIEEILNEKPDVLEPGARVFENDLIGTMDDDSHCQLNFLGFSERSVRLAPHTRIIARHEVVNKDEKSAKKKVYKTKLSLYKGKLRAKVNRIRKNGAFEVTTPVAVCGVRGTEEICSHTPPKNPMDPNSFQGGDMGKSQVQMLSGMSVAGQHKFPNQNFQLRGGMQMNFNNFQLPNGPQPIPPNIMRGLKQSGKIQKFSQRAVHGVTTGKVTIDQAQQNPHMGGPGGGPGGPGGFKGGPGAFNPGFQQAVGNEITQQFAPTPGQTGGGGGGDGGDPTSSNTGINPAGNEPPPDGNLDPNSPNFKINDNLNFIGGGGSGPGSPVPGESIPTIGTGGGVGN